MISATFVAFDGSVGLIDGMMRSCRQACVSTAFSLTITRLPKYYSPVTVRFHSCKCVVGECANVTTLVLSWELHAAVGVDKCALRRSSRLIP